MASIDKALKDVKNKHMNTDPVTKEYFQSGIIYMYGGDVRAFLDNSDYVDPDAVTQNQRVRYSGYLLRFDAKTTALSLDNICNGIGSNPTYKLMRLKLPTGTSSITFAGSAGGTYTELSNIDSEAATNGFCGSNNPGGIYFRKEDRGGETFYNFNWGGSDGFTGKIPEGYWDLVLGSGSNEKLIGRFDLATSDPIYPADMGASAGRPKLYIPSFSIVTNSDNVITSIGMKLYLWNTETHSWGEVTDLSIFSKEAKFVNVTLTDFNCQGQQNDTITFTAPATGNIYTQVI